jgi:hypothetical protein
MRLIFGHFHRRNVRGKNINELIIQLGIPTNSCRRGSQGTDLYATGHRISYFHLYSVCLLYKIVTSMATRFDRLDFKYVQFYPLISHEFTLPNIESLILINKTSK